MSEQTNKADAFRQRRVRRLKRYIVTAAMAFVTLPLIMCIVLAVQMSRMGNALNKMSKQINTLNEVVAEQREKLSVLEWESIVFGEGSVRRNRADREVTGSSLVPEPIKDETAAGVAETVPEELSEESIGEIKRERRFYLTFDDGPSCYTDDILDILDSYGVKATFFVVAKETDSAKDALRQIAERGHSIGMHSYSHRYSEVYRSVDDFVQDLKKIQSYVYDAVGEDTILYRFPGGSSNEVSRINMDELVEYLDEHGILFFDWNVSSGDAAVRTLSVEQIVRNVSAGIAAAEEDSIVILMHDSADKRTTVEALPIIIENILASEDATILPITTDTEPIHHKR